LEKVKLDGEQLLGLDDQLKSSRKAIHTFSENPAKWEAAQTRQVLATLK
jgi:hypothetical protein